MAKISVIINTLNEERNIGLCLQSVNWADEIILVDMYSNDNTIAIAKTFAAVKIFLYDRCNYVEPAREFAINQASHDWVFILDADELVTATLHQEIRNQIANNHADAIKFNRKNYMFGESINCYLWRKDPQLRLFKKSSLIGFNPSIHATTFLFAPHAKILYVDKPQATIIHFNYISVEQFIDKMNRYTTIEAQNIQAKLKPPLSTIKILRDLFLFIPKFLFLDRGWKNGGTGLGLAALMLGYKVSTYLKQRLLQKYNDPNYQELIYQQYQQIGKKIVQQYQR
jgi:glycosyltransferase involved in cell wall biosynthesis